MREIFLTEDTVRQFERLPESVKPFVRDVVKLHLIEADPSDSTRNKFRLRRPSEHADYELHAGEWRVFYRVERKRIIVTLIGEKVGSRLIVEGEAISL